MPSTHSNSGYLGSRCEESGAPLVGNMVRIGKALAGFVGTVIKTYPRVGDISACFDVKSDSGRVVNFTVAREWSFTN